jgi:hypothetical protein
MTPIFDPGCRLVRLGQLRECNCGWPMTPAQAHRHLLVYRCDPERCGQHTADVTDVEAGLLREYRQWLAQSTLDAWTRDEQVLIVEAYAHLIEAWTESGRLRQARFSSLPT